MIDMETGSVCHTQAADQMVIMMTERDIEQESNMLYASLHISCSFGKKTTLQ